MELYSGSTADFVQADAQRDIVRRLSISFFEYYRYEPSQSEKRSWDHSLHALAAQIKRNKLLDQGMILEMQLPLTSRRLDCILTGTSSQGDQNAVLIELKQWTDAAPAEEDRCVLVEFGGVVKTVLHPSHQANDYAQYLRDHRAVFYEDRALPLQPCAWLHNFQGDPDSTLLDRAKFNDVMEAAPLFGAVDNREFGDFLSERLEAGDGCAVLDRILKSRFAPSKKLMEHTAAVIKGQSPYILLDEQRVAYEKILAASRRSVNRRSRRTAIIVEGGPGTGKSVIALNVMAELLAQGKTVQHATGSKAFTENLRKTLGSRAGSSFRYFNSFVDAEDGEIDVLICDEAHRIRESSNNRFTPAHLRSNALQIEELFKSSKVVVFFIDDKQVVRPGEIGSVALIEDIAHRDGIAIEREKLTAQFRCAGSDEFIDWVDTLLGIRETDAVELDLGNAFEFAIADTPEELEASIRSKAAAGDSARLAAGFCWKWSKPTATGLIDDVVIGNFRRPWNAQPDATKLPPGVPKSNYWATDKNGIDQIGCVYTAQGFEFDYIGVIWGPDLVYRKDAGGWVGQKAMSCDPTVKRAQPDHFRELVKNTYRVLLTRGLKGCFVYFTDPETRAFVESRLVAGSP